MASVPGLEPTLQRFAHESWSGGRMPASQEPEIAAGRRSPGTNKRKDEAGLETSRALPAPGLEILRPAEEAHQLRPFLPHKEPEVAGVDGVSLSAGIGFYAPFQVFAAPGHEAMASGRIPQEANRHAQASSQKYSVQRAALLVALPHVLDDFFGHVLSADVIRSVGDRLFDLCNLLQAFFINAIKTVFVRRGRIVNVVHTGL